MKKITLFFTLILWMPLLAQAQASVLNPWGLEVHWRIGLSEGWNELDLDGDGDQDAVLKGYWPSSVPGAAPDFTQILMNRGDGQQILFVPTLMEKDLIAPVISDVVGWRFRSAHAYFLDRAQRPYRLYLLVGRLKPDTDTSRATFHLFEAQEPTEEESALMAQAPTVFRLRNTALSRFCYDDIYAAFAQEASLTLVPNLAHHLQDAGKIGRANCP